jgi:hypothetical protein
LVTEQTNSNPPVYGYELPLDPDSPAVKKTALEVVIRPEPIEAGQRLTLGQPPNERHWEVVAVEPTSRDGERVGGSRGPLGWTGASPADAIFSGRLVLREIT